MNPARTGAPAGARGAEGALSTQTGEQERRRGQRVTLRIKVLVHVALQGKATSFAAATMSVSPDGALVVIERGLPIDTRLVLEHSGTRERVACRIARQPREMPEGFHVTLEFDSPAPDFWKIAFPPAGWRTDDL